MAEKIKTKTNRDETEVSRPPEPRCLVGRGRCEHRRVWAENALNGVPLVRRERLLGLGDERRVGLYQRRLLRLFTFGLSGSHRLNLLQLPNVTGSLIRDGRKVDAWGGK
jgi:hypothetical protein